MCVVWRFVAIGEMLASVPPCSAADWDRACIADGEPLVQPETAALWLPQMLNLDLLGAVSFSKGCYTGQEVVARIHFRGHVNRHLRWLMSASPLRAGARVPFACVRKDEV